jgi:tight adherence protein B
VAVAATLSIACLGALLGGPVAAAIAGTYGGLAVATVRRRRAAAAAAQERVRRLDHLSALAADLRAGLPPPSVPALDVGPQDRLVTLTNAAVRLAERTGAPLADLVERIEADARAMDRAVASATSQAAGVRATAWLLAGLPLGGIALGYGIGVDPLNVLLHTPAGAACAVAAIVLQLAGLAWAERLSSSWARSV